MLRLYCEHMHTNEPVHSWEVPQQSRRGDHRPEHLRMADVAVRAADRRLVCTDDGVGVQTVEIARVKVVRLSLRRHCHSGGGRSLLVSVVTHPAPTENQVAR